MSQGRTHRRFDRAFKSQAVELTDQPGMSVPKAAEQLGVHANALYRWKKELTEAGVRSDSSECQGSGETQRHRKPPSQRGKLGPRGC